MDFHELGRRLMELGTPDDRVKVLDVDHSATFYRLPQIEARVRVGVFYLRPPAGITAQELKDLFDEADSPAFRYKLTSGIGTDHMELMTPDEYARQYFSSSPKLIHIEGARRLAREQLEAMFDEMKEVFDAQSFPHLDDVTISGHKIGSEELSTEVKLLASDGDFRNMSRLERAVTHKILEANLHREIAVGRHLVKDTKPEIILSTTAKATAKGREFLNDLATYLIKRDGGIQTEAKPSAPSPVQQSTEQVYKSLVQAIPRTREAVKQPAEIVNRAASEFHATLAGMIGFKSLEASRTHQGINVQFPWKLFGGRGFDEFMVRELESVTAAILGVPGLHDGWNAYYSYEKKERVLKIRFTAPNEELQSPWSKLGEA